MGETMGNKILYKFI